MQRGVIFTVEAVYILVIVFAVLMVFVSSIQTIDYPDYDQIQAMKATHDIGYNQSTTPPLEYQLSPCSGINTVKLSYYNKEVCMK